MLTRYLLQLSCCAGFACAAVSVNAQSLSIQLSDQNGSPVNDAVVELLLPDEMRSNYQMVSTAVVDQFDKEFVPHVSIVVLGNLVSFPNSDDILHHVYSFSPINTFNIPLYGKGEQSEYAQVFDKAGVVEIGCNIHDWMLAYIYVAESSLHKLSGETGVAELTDLPEGTFELRIWHPRLPDQDVMMTRTVELQSGVVTELEYMLELQRDRRVRRAPSSNRTRYR